MNNGLQHKKTEGHVHPKMIGDLMPSELITNVLQVIWLLSRGFWYNDKRRECDKLLHNIVSQTKAQNTPNTATLSKTNSTARAGSILIFTFEAPDVSAFVTQASLFPGDSEEVVCVSWCNFCR